MKRSSDSLITYRWLRSHSYSFIVVFIQGTCIRIKMTIFVFQQTLIMDFTWHVRPLNGIRIRIAAYL